MQNKGQDHKDYDPVTDADRNAERIMRQLLDMRRPDDGVLGEEFGQREGSSGLKWVLDPIDGTRSFISGLPVWGTLIAVSDGDGPLFGIVEQPYIGERYEGGFGIASMESRFGQSLLATRGTERLADAILFSTFPEIGTVCEREAFSRLSARTHFTRYGTDCYAYAMLASGCIDLVVEAGLYPYDTYAPIAIVTAAGGVVTDWSGGPAHQGSRIIAAANSGLHSQALDVLAYQG